MNSCTRTIRRGAFLNLWEERWSSSWVPYAVGLMPVLPGFFPETWAPAACVGMVLLCTLTATIEGRPQERAEGLAVSSAVLQLSAVVICALPFVVAVRIGGIRYFVALLLMAGAAVATAIDERGRCLTMPRYGVEALVANGFAIGYLAAMESPPSLRFLCGLLVIHAGILSIAVLRNSRIRAELIEGTVAEGGYTRKVWRISPRVSRDAHPILAALALPSGIIGSVLVAAEALLLMVVVLFLR